MRVGFETRLVLHEINTPNDYAFSEDLQKRQILNLEKKAVKKEENCHFFENLDQCTGLLVRQIEFNQCFLYTLG